MLLSTTYFGPVQWYQKLLRSDHVLIERHETFQKQTYRNRCLIATTQGVQALTVPVSGGEHCIKDVHISDHGNWRHLHWQALATAYGDSPFFEYYEDDLCPFFQERRWEFLLDFNEDIRQTMCSLLDIHPSVAYTENYIKKADSIESTLVSDYREAIRPKHPLPDPTFQPRRYYQVFEARHGFLPNLSILDLLFNMGPESIFFLT